MSRLSLMMLCVFLLLSGVESVSAAKIRHLSTINADETGGSMLYPTGVACGEGNLLVADSGNGRLLSGKVLENRDPLLQSLQIPQIKVPIGVLRLTNGNYLVLDGQGKRVGKIDGVNMTFQGYLKLQGVPEPSETIIKSLAVDSSDRIYLLDSFGARVLVADESGQFLRAIDFPENHGFISDLSVDQAGIVYLVDSVENQILVATSEDKQFKPLAHSQEGAVDFLTDVVAGQTGLFLVDRRQGRIVLVGFEGSILEYKFGSGFENGQLRSPSDLCLDSKGRLFVADQGNNRVQIFEVQP